MYVDSRLTFGVFIPTIIGSQIAGELMNGLLTTARELDVNLIFYIGGRLNPFKENKRDENIYKLVDKNKIDGLIIWSSNICRNVTEEETINFHEFYKNIPVITIGKKIGKNPAIIIDNYNSMKTLVTHFIKVHKYKKIGFIKGPQDSYYAMERFKAYIDALKENNVLYDEKLVSEYPLFFLPYEAGRKAVEYFLDERKLRLKIDIEAVISFSDEILLGFLDEFKKRNYRIPDDLAVAGFDNLLGDLAFFSPLTSVEIYYENIGRLAIESLYSLIKGERIKEIIISSCELRFRESCGCKNIVLENTGINEKQLIDYETSRAIELIERKKTDIIKMLSSCLENIYKDKDAVLVLSNEIFYTFLSDLKEKTNKFLALLKSLVFATLNKIENQEYWNYLLSSLQKALFIPKDCDFFLYIDKIFQEARLLIHLAFDFHQAKEVVEEKSKTSLLLNVSQELITSTTLDELKYKLGEACAKLDVREIYLLSLKNEIKYLKYVFTSENIKKEELKSKKKIENFIPDFIFSKEERSNFILLPLKISEKEIEYIIFKLGTIEYQSYMLLKNEITNTLNQILNIQKLNRAHQKTTKFIDELNLTNTQLTNALNALWEELEIAQKIQKAFLPFEPTLDGYEIKTFMKPATEVGGDLFDVFVAPDGMYYLIIGDVSGHGVTAGLVMMMLQICNYSNIITEKATTPKELAVLSNKTLFYTMRNRLNLDHFITACFLKFDKEGNFEYSGAHEKILVYRAKQDEVEEIATAGMWLGVVEDISSFIRVDKFKLEKDDVLLLYTDGVTEICNELKELFGLERLKDVFKKSVKLAVNEILKKIIDSINSFKSIQKDDITLVILKKL